MPKFIVQIDTGNDAFQPDPMPEISRILRAINCTSGYLYDTNGNRVGEFALITTPAEDAADHPYSEGRDQWPG